MAKKKTDTRRYAGAGFLFLASACAFLGSFGNMVITGAEENKVDESVNTQVLDIAEHVQKSIIDASDEDRKKPISELVPAVKTGLPDTSVYFYGDYNNGFCITGYNEKGIRSDDGMKLVGGSSLAENFSCPTDASQMTLMTGPGDNKVAGGADYEEPKLGGGDIFLISSIGAFIGIMGAAASLPYRPLKGDEYVLDYNVPAGSPPKHKPLAQALSATGNTTPVVAKKPAVHTVSAPASRIKTLVSRYEAIKSEWASYELDLLKILEFPALTDMSIPATGKFHKALYLAGILAPEDVVKPLSSDEAKRFEDSVLDLEYCFRAMLNEAKRLRWNSYSEKERSSLRTAKNLLSIALNSASSENERQVAYKRLIKEVEGIIVLPEQAMLELESKISPAITAGEDSYETNKV